MDTSTAHDAWSDRPREEASLAAADARLAQWARECSEESAPARDLLRRLWEGDPLDLGRRCSRRLSERALLLEPTRVEHRARARLALASTIAAAREGEDAGLGIAAGVDGAIDDLLRADACTTASSATGDPAAPEAGALLAAILCDTLGIEPAAVPRAAAAFNTLAEPTRQVFFAAVIEGRSIESCASDVRSPNGADADETVWRRLARAFSALGSAGARDGAGESTARRLGEADPPRPTEETRA
ncbi:MAG: hypothetical protein QF860_13805 [Planctomycetota bacterium]|jgi:DNA-directed RNA polymerase specialized sigma24 family protein|nr:hypothetical protein [Planctomycetota bacterium]